MFFSASILLSALAASGLADGALVPYTGRKPELPKRKPFGFGIATIGGAANASAVYLVDNMVDLREALQLDYPRTVYVKGLIDGSVIMDNSTGKLVKTNCDSYIQQAAPQFNFTQYMMSLNTSYMANLAALPPTDVVEGRSVADFIALLKQQVGWAVLTSKAQRNAVHIAPKSNLTLIGMDSNAYINGAQLLFANTTNVIIRNLRFSPPRDCFPEPESPSAWNAQYDAVSLATATNFWVDGNIFVDGRKTVPRDSIGLWGWFVDRYDGLFDCRVASDNITFSHNVVGNHHKSMLFGGSRNNEAVDVGKMRFTLFGNSIVSSESRSPMVRHGTFYLVNNMYTQVSNALPLFNESNIDTPRPPVPVNATGWPVPYAPQWLYNIGVDNFASVLVSGNVFRQSGLAPYDETRIFSFNNVKNITKPTRMCIPASQPKKAVKHLGKLAEPASILNGKKVDLADVASKRYRYDTSRQAVVAGGLNLDCGTFAYQKMPRSFESGNEVYEYIKNEAGQVGKHEP